MQIKDNKKRKMIATNWPSFTMKMLRPIANLIARYTSPSQVCSVLKEFSIVDVAQNPAEAEALILQAFESLHEEKDEDHIKIIIEKFLKLYSQLINEKHHDKGLIGRVRDILQQGHFNLIFNIARKDYFIRSFEWPVHDILMRVEGTTETDFNDQNKPILSKLSHIRKQGVEIGEKIKAITFIHENNAPHKVLSFYVNGDIRDIHKLQTLSSEVKKLAGIANGEEFQFNKQTHDYINTNRKCVLYCKGKYQLTKIIDGYKRPLHISKGIKVETINEKTLKRRSSQVTKVDA